MKADIESALSANQEKLLRKKNVVGVAVGKRIAKGEETDETCIVVFVSRKEPLGALSKRDLVPASLGAVRTDVVETGEFIAYQTPPADRQKKFRPAPPGVSIGHYKITAGTFGCVVVDKEGHRLILSNNHVLANSNDAKLGDPILQPGRYDGGNLQDTIAGLENFVEIKFQNDNSPCTLSRAVTAILNFFSRIFRRKTRFRAVVSGGENLVDAALGYPGHPSDIVDEIIDIGKPVGTKPPSIGMSVIKSGRTTGTQRGAIQYTNAVVSVSYGPGRLAKFIDQIVITPGEFSAGGDSGSAICTFFDDEPYLVGLLFAGSGSHTIGNKIENVFRLLDVGL